MRLASLVAWGMIDHTCDASCSQPPDDPNAPGDYIACPACERRDDQCKACGGAGVFRIPCPKRFADTMTWDVIEAARLVKESGWPGGKGWGDEPAALVEAVQWVWSEFQRIKNELSKR